MPRQPDLSLFGLPITLRVLADVEHGDSTFVLPLGVRVESISTDEGNDDYIEIEAKLFLELKAFIDHMNDHAAKVKRTPDKLFGAPTVEMDPAERASRDALARALEATARQIREGEIGGDTY